MSESENPWIEETVRVETFDGQVGEVVTTRYPNPEYWRNPIDHLSNHMQQYDLRPEVNEFILTLQSIGVEALFVFTDGMMPEALQNRMSQKIQACANCGYFVPPPFNACGAFRKPTMNCHEATDCPAWEAK